MLVQKQHPTLPWLYVQLNRGGAKHCKPKQCRGEIYFPFTTSICTILQAIWETEWFKKMIVTVKGIIYFQSSHLTRCKKDDITYWNLHNIKGY